MNLSSIKKGQVVKIDNLDAVDDLLQKRLHSFGIGVGSIVCLKQKGLFSGACILEYEGQSIGVRQRDLKNIEVVPV